MLNIIKIWHFVQKKGIFPVLFTVKNIFLQTVTREGFVPTSIAILIIYLGHNYY